MQEERSAFWNMAVVNSSQIENQNTRESTNFPQFFVEVKFNISCRQIELFNTLIFESFKFFAEDITAMYLFKCFQHNNSLVLSFRYSAKHNIIIVNNTAIEIWLLID